MPRNLSKLPSKEEQIALRDTGALMKRNLGELKVSEMLDEIRCEVPVEGTSEMKFLSKLKNVIIKSLPITNINKKFLVTNKLESLSLLHYNKSQSINLDYNPPTKIEIGGSYALRSQTKPFENIDVYVVMPDECFESNDLLNHVYFDKRRLYLGVLVTIIKNNSLCLNDNVNISFLKGDIRKPIISFYSVKKKYHIRVIPTLNGKNLNLQRLASWKNNVRPLSWLSKIAKNKKRKMMDDDEDEADADVNGNSMDHTSLPATPNYNMAIIEDLSILSTFKMIKEYSDKYQYFCDAVILIKVWLHQKGLRNLLDSVDSHITSLLLIHVISASSGSAQTNPLALFHLFLKVLVDYDFTATQTKFGESSHRYDKDTSSCDASHYLWLEKIIPFANSKPIAGVDLNIMWRVSQEGFSEFKRIAKATLGACQSNPESIYEIAFMEKSHFTNRYDMYFSVDMSKSDFSDRSSAMFEISQNELEDQKFYGSELNFFANKVQRILEAALGNRVNAVRTIPTFLDETYLSNESCNSHYPILDSSQKLQVNKRGVTIGLVLNHENLKRRVDRGPSSNDATASEEFQAFWGQDKCELRKFQDGSIVFAVLWGSDSTSSGLDIVNECTRYILGRHLPLYCGTEGQDLHLCNSPTRKCISDGADKFRDVMLVFDELKDTLVNRLQGLPLMIMSVVAISPLLRFTALLPPSANLLLLASQNKSKKLLSGKYASRVIPPIEIVGILEESTKWPKDLQVAAKLKTALLIEMGEALYKQFKLQSVPHENSIDIIIGGHIFRLVVITSVERDRVKNFKASFINRDLKLLTLRQSHHGAVRNLHIRHKTYGDAVRLFHYWLARSIFSNYLSVEMVELIVASIYLNTPDHNIPTTAQNGFRSVLLLLGNHDWETEPLVLDFSGDVTVTERTTIQTKFDECRKTNPSAKPIYIVSSYDRITGFECNMDNDSFERVVLKMMKKSALNSWRLLDKYISDSLLNVDSFGDKASMEYIVDSQFVSSNLNVNMHFSPHIVCKAKNKGDTNDNNNNQWGNWENNIERGPSFARTKLYANLSQHELALKNIICRPNLCVHPIQYEIIENLKSKFGKYALFFWDEIEGSTVGVVWRPSIFLPKKFSVLESRHHIANTTGEEDEDNTTVVFNVAEVLVEMIAEANGLIENIDYNQSENEK